MEKTEILDLGEIIETADHIAQEAGQTALAGAQNEIDQISNAKDTAAEQAIQKSRKTHLQKVSTL